MRRALLAASIVTLAASTGAGQAGFDASGRIDAAAQDYRRYGRVDDHARWAPADCILPDPSTMRVSRPRVSRAEAAHERKVYFVYASDRAAYERLSARRGRPRVGFTVVKESFTPREVARGSEGPDGSVRGDIPGHERSVVRSSGYRAHPDAEGRVIVPGDPAGLYVMQYVGRRVRDSDEGWIYGTIDPSGEVTAAGRVESCMECHRSAPHARLFGLGE